MVAASPARVAGRAVSSAFQLAPVAHSAPATAQFALVACFMRFFTGSFDNAAQAADDAAAGLGPREGGGHEHIRCGVQRVSAPVEVGDALLADYRFPARGDASFRTRLYTVSEEIGTASITMRIFRPTEQTLAKLARADFDAAALEWSADDFAHHISECDVRWTWVPAGGPLGGAHFDGELIAGDATVFSPILKQTIRVTDSLQLFEDALWINDRGFDPDGKQIYGNWRNVPYKLRRCADVCSAAPVANAR
ncbi:hypothetical protein KFE25_003538 [Diacronema lutheri]|uniref:Uncharacterized protein n=2 Tax=Diacronema lutheri TaxID=2081491 RepID=A0A8J5XJC0_DIALT|nr:hypothetical protein KFE25_003538 [Diacronema lutheri]